MFSSLDQVVVLYTPIFDKTYHVQDAQSIPAMDEAFNDRPGFKFRLHKHWGFHVDVIDILIPWPLSMPSLEASKEVVTIEENVLLDTISRSDLFALQEYLAQVSIHCKARIVAHDFTDQRLH